MSIVIDYAGVCEPQLYNLGHIKGKSAVEHGQNAQIQIILRMRKVASGRLHSIHTFCRRQ